MSMLKFQFVINVTALKFYINIIVNRTCCVATATALNGGKTENCSGKISQFHFKAK